MHIHRSTFLYLVKNTPNQIVVCFDLRKTIFSQFLKVSRLDNDVYRSGKKGELLVFFFFFFLTQVFFLKNVKNSFADDYVFL